jgi:hypothetical protein
MVGCEPLRTMAIEVLMILGILALGGASALVLRRGRTRQRVELEERARQRKDVDTVLGWPPEVTRLLTSGARAAHAVLAKALPECMIFAQVPMARFLKVPRRNSYAEWLTRVGHLSADFLICDRASLVIGVVLIHAAHDSERSARRRARVARVLKAAGVAVFQWREEGLPSPDTARAQIIQRTGAPGTAPVVVVTRPAAVRQPSGPGSIPVPEVAENIDEGPRREPPPSTWFTDIDSGPIPLDPTRKPASQAGSP